MAEIKIDVDSVGGIAIGVCTGTLRESDIRYAVDQMIQALNSVDNIEHMFWDLGDASLDLSGGAVKSLVEYVGRVAPPASGGKTAYFVKDNLSFATMRMYASYRWEKDPLVRVFSERSTAFKWLLEETILGRTS
ncbi:MAG: hypothetical protein JJ934_01900 [Pseudomonadales bacterium]|nr:hypothetical protein [Pseudomonadales bacterium]MBO6566660.1 hypothetical protein [Pseudomonadales bacterium]MBO6594438.1 hypothetical protein [Pseudomonadales bacterium]MBO6655614.1 hypothetical protein [Pseudomonadales bacterium]MBO6700941.1 hypothetical protein [Pseudomonadales bacterium]